MSFTITIERCDRVQRETTEYQLVADTGNPKDGGRLFEYVPTTKSVIEKTEVFKQTLEDLDLVTVIAAINGLDSRERAA